MKGLHLEALKPGWREGCAMPEAPCVGRGVARAWVEVTILKSKKPSTQAWQSFQGRFPNPRAPVTYIVGYWGI